MVQHVDEFSSSALPLGLGTLLKLGTLLLPLPGGENMVVMLQ